MKSLTQFRNAVPQVQTFVGIQENFPLEKFLSDFKIPSDQTVLMEQVHGNQVAVVEAASSEKISSVDALLTKKSGVYLIVRTADCVPILLSESSGWVGAIHAGRRGTQAEILSQTLETLIRQGGDISKTFIFLGPAISFKNYEINPETHEHFDLEAENFKQAVAAGVPPQNIFKSGICTFADERYPSYRRDKTDQRFFSAIAR